jgi:iron complex transport system permease protein
MAGRARRRGAGVAVLLGFLLGAGVDPFSATRALTWLSGSTYGRSCEHLVPLAVVCLLVLPLAWAGHRYLDLVSLDEDTPRVPGLNVPAPD